MEHRKNAVGTPCPPCESAPFLENRGQAAGPRGQAVPGGQGPAAACCAAKGQLWLCLGRYCLCPCVSGRGLAVLGTAGFPQLFARGPWHGCFLRFVCRRGAVLFIPGRKKAHAGKLVLAGRDAVPGAFLCPAVRGHAAGGFALPGAAACGAILGAVCRGQAHKIAPGQNDACIEQIQQQPV